MGQWWHSSRGKLKLSQEVSVLSPHSLRFPRRQAPGGLWTILMVSWNSETANLLSHTIWQWHRCSLKPIISYGLNCIVCCCVANSSTSSAIRGALTCATTVARCDIYSHNQQKWTTREKFTHKYSKEKDHEQVQKCHSTSTVQQSVVHTFQGHSLNLVVSWHEPHRGDYIWEITGSTRNDELTFIHKPALLSWPRILWQYLMSLMVIDGYLKQIIFFSFFDIFIKKKNI